jgi:hypothetical protein
MANACIVCPTIDRIVHVCQCCCGNRRDSAVLVCAQGTVEAGGVDNHSRRCASVTVAVALDLRWSLGVLAVQNQLAVVVASRNPRRSLLPL